MRQESPTAAVPAASPDTSGTMPWAMRLLRWMRAKLAATMARTPRKRGLSAACSREEPWP
jgi:hypothetical protein